MDNGELYRESLTDDETRKQHDDKADPKPE